MEKIYKKSPLAFISSFIAMIFATILVFYVSSAILERMASIVCSLIVFILFLIMIISQMKTKVIVDGNTLKIIKGKKEFTYQLDEVHLFSEQRNNDSFTLSILKQDGLKERFDLSMLGSRSFNKLLEDLGLCGEKSKIIKLKDRNLD